jgi:hypothetical protein
VCAGFFERREIYLYDIFGIVIFRAIKQRSLFIRLFCGIE